MRSEVRQLDLCLEAGLPADPPGLRLGEWLWRLPAAVGTDQLVDWLQHWSARTMPDHYPRWLTLVGRGSLDHRLLYRLRACGMPALVLRPQPGTRLEPLTEQALRAGKSDIVIAPLPADPQHWLARYDSAAAIGHTHALLI